MIKKTLLLLCIALLLPSGKLLAQLNNQFQIANRLMQQQRYEDALPILQLTNREQPQVFLFFDKLIECHIQLKQYDEALSQVEKAISSRQNVSLSRVLEAELYHFKGDTTRAFDIWEQNLNQYPTQLQIYLNTATSMVERRAYSKAIDVYMKGRSVFNNDQLFMSEVPNTYMQAGKYEEAIAEWLTLIKVNPQQTSALQRLLLRYNDPLLYDITILELEDQLNEMAIENPAYSSFYEFQIWLLLENKLFRRAFSTAREFENRTSNFNFSLFNVGRKLTDNKEFELAIDAFDFYIQNSTGEIKWRAMEQKADVQTRWAKYFDDYNLDLEGKKEELFFNAGLILDTIIDETVTYSRLDKIFLKKAELSLDFVYNLEEAKEATKRLKSIPQMYDTPEANYLDGRIHLAQEEYTLARISFTRSNKKADIGELAEKTRYFLALTDFYAGDFEFAKIQLKTLGRQNTSYYANDALELRLWVQEGLSADTTGSYLTQFANANYLLSVGRIEDAKNSLYEIIDNTSTSPFKDDSFVLLAGIGDATTFDYMQNISTFLVNSPALSLKERLLWERAKAADEAYNITNSTEQELTFEVDLQKVLDNYGAIILEYPQGFYAPFARKRLAELPKPNS
ncbi:MAG: hypothetical protein RLN81_02110 [Balneolaceae bacterium]